MKKIVVLMFLIVFISGCAKLDLESYGFVLKKDEEVKENNSNTDNSDISNDYNWSTDIDEENVLRAHYIDVGQADSIFIELPNNEVMLIDGAESQNSEDIISYIKELNYQKIDYLIGTHPHADHIGGLSKIIESFEIGTIYMPKVVATSKTYENLLVTIANKGLKIKTGKAGVNIIDEDNFKISIISPNKDSYDSYNNYSLVIKMVYKEASYLFMGDAEELVEKEIISDVKSDVLKVGHHGSNTSSSEDFLKKVSPKYAVISVGENNKYNHPSDITLEKLKKYTSNIYRTDINGNIIISSDGKNYNVKLEKGE